MTIRIRLMSTLLACSLLPMLCVGVISYQLGDEQAAALTDEAHAAIEDRATAQLTSVSAARKADIVHWFENAKAHVTSLAKQHDLIVELPLLSQAMTELAKDTAPAVLETARRELASYYGNDFESEYRRQASGQNSGIQTALAQLDAPSVLAQL